MERKVLKRRIKGLAAFVLAVVMMFGSSISALAADNYWFTPGWDNDTSSTTMVVGDVLTREDGIGSNFGSCSLYWRIEDGGFAEFVIGESGNCLNFTFIPGKSYAIVGASGSGKSTLLNLLMAAHGEYAGSIYYDDIDLRRIQSESLYNMISVIQQNVFIFNASILDNITMFSDFPEEEVERAIELSGLRRLIAERGKDYLCGENGSGLSGGEKQRISIARSLLKKSQVLLVDEATAALDAQTAFQVSSAILDLEELTRIVVTHALDEILLKRYDCVLALKNGKIAEAGTFEELMEKRGYFYSLYTVSQ